jgi:hypothetical protein
MAGLKLAKLPDRTPVKLTISIAPDLHNALADYAAAYRDAYGQDASMSDLIPAMLVSFLDSDRAFQRARPVGKSRPSSSLGVGQ